MKNGDYRYCFPIGKIYKKHINHWFYDIMKAAMPGRGLIRYSC